MEGRLHKAFISHASWIKPIKSQRPGGRDRLIQIDSSEVYSERDEHGDKISRPPSTGYSNSVNEEGAKSSRKWKF